MSDKDGTMSGMRRYHLADHSAVSRLDEIRQRFQTSSYSDLKETYSQNQSSISEPPAESYLPLPSPKSGQVFTAYTLPHGMILMVPENTNHTLKSQLQKILQAVQPESKKEPQ